MSSSSTKCFNFAVCLKIETRILQTTRRLPCRADYDAVKAALPKMGGGFLFECPVTGCTAAHKCKTDLMDHVNSSHLRFVSHPCHCGASQFSRKALRKHQRTHEGAPTSPADALSPSSSSSSSSSESNPSSPVTPLSPLTEFLFTDSEEHVQFDLSEFHTEVESPVNNFLEPSTDFDFEFDFGFEDLLWEIHF